MRMRIAGSVFSALALLIASGAAAADKQPVYDDPAHVDEDFAYQGEYAGDLDGGRQALGVQVVALGNGQFMAVAYVGGLPGDGWNGFDRVTAEGKRQDNTVLFESDQGRAELKGGVLTVTTNDGLSGKLKKVQRRSPTLGKKPPAGAVVLFDGSSADQWEGGRMTDDGLLMPGCRSKQKFLDHSVHIEFRLPYKPLARGQARGNSGIYLQGRYEVQMLDSFGLEGKNNECGGLYEVKDPDLNMCYPPLSWQTYDIDFKAARYENGRVVEPPRITVRHNGVLVHRDVPLPADRSTRAAPIKPGPDPGPVYLQDHGNPVRYRNIWVVPGS